MSGQVRICVRQGRECIELAPGTPTLSSEQSSWEGALLERHAHGPHTADRHQHLSHFVCLHLSEPAPFVWRSQGKQGTKIIGPGSIMVVSRGTEDSVSFPKPVERILLNLEPSVCSRRFLTMTQDAMWNSLTNGECLIRRLNTFFVHSKQISKPASLGAGSSESPCSVRSLCIFKAVMV